MLGKLFEYLFLKDQEESTAAQFRSIIREEAPAMRDAVVEGFAIHPDDLKRVATPELLDDLASNALALRLGDEQFACEIYRDIRTQAIRSAEWWHDVEVRIRLSSALERSTNREEHQGCSSVRRDGGVGVHDGALRPDSS